MEELKETMGFTEKVLARANRPFYILNEAGEPVHVEDVLVWGQWMEDNIPARQVALTDLPELKVFVSTVFLGIDHDMTFRGEPVLWETMVFSDEKRTDTLGGHTITYHRTTGITVRYNSRAAAVLGHQRVVQAIRDGGDLPQWEEP